MNTLIIFCASSLAYIMAAVFAIAVVWPTRRWRMAIDALLSAAIARGLVKTVIVYFWHRPRPYIAMPSLHPLIAQAPNEAYASFPSGHAIFFFALAMALYMYDKKLGAWFFAGATIMGIARVAAGVHYPGDIIGGAVLGILTAIVVCRLSALYFPDARLRNKSESVS